MGHGRHSNASTLIELCGLGCFGPGSLQLQLRRAYVDCKKFAKDRGFAFAEPCFTPDRLAATGSRYADMGNSKAHNSRVIIAYCAHQAVRYQHLDELGQVRAATCWGLAYFCDRLGRAGRWLSDDDIEAMRLGGRTYLDGYAWLARYSVDAQTLRWVWNPKHHQFEHLLDEIMQDRLNPRYYWNYADEDLVGRVATTAKNCHPWTMCLRRLQRWMIGLGLQWADRGSVPFGLPPWQARVRA